MKNKVFGYVLFLIGLVIVFFFLFDDKKVSTKMKQSHEQLYQMEINGIVSNISQNRGTVILKLKNYSENIYFTNTRNYDYTPSSIEEFIERGDSIHKTKNSNELSVFRGNKKFYFVIDKSINK